MNKLLSGFLILCLGCSSQTKGFRATLVVTSCEDEMPIQVEADECGKAESDD